MDKYLSCIIKKFIKKVFILLIKKSVKMIKKQLVVVIFFILLIIPLVLAKETIINIKTLAEHDVIIKILDSYPNEGETNFIESFNETADENGDVSVTSYTSKSQIDIIVIVEKDGIRKTINGKIVHEFEKKITGGIINLEVKEKPVVVEPEAVCGNSILEINEKCDDGNLIEGDGCDANCSIEPEKEVVAEEESEVEVVAEEIEEQPETGKLTGLLIDNGKALVMSKTTYYFILGIFVLGVLLFIIVKTKKILKKRANTYLDFKVRPFREFKEEDYDKRILNVEKKIKEAEQELNEITGKRKQLKEAKERFEKDKRELERLEKN